MKILKCGFLYIFIMFAVCAPGLWAAGNSDKIQTVHAQGAEIWEHDFNVEGQKKGLYNIIVNARDRAGNEAVSGPFNLHVDHHSGLPVIRVIYPENNAVIRQNINLLGVASGHFGISRVLTRLDNGEYTEATGTEYWNEYIDFSSVPDGKHTLYVQAIDEKEVAGPIEVIHFTLDTSPPHIEITSHTIGDIISGPVLLKGDAKDPNAIKSIEYSEDGEKWTKVPGKHHGRTETDFVLPYNTKKLPEGPFLFYLRATDTTDMVTVKPYLFFVTNTGPELELYTPVPGESVFDEFFLSGRVFHPLGIKRLHYEWGLRRGEIELRPGDPYWHIKLDAVKASSGTIKVTAVDKAGNVVHVTRKLADKRKVKIPILVIDHPSVDALNGMKKGMPADTAIYGHIEMDGVDPHSVKIGELGQHHEMEALSAFRIDPGMIPASILPHNLKLTPVAADSSHGKTLSFKLLKHETMTKGEFHVNIISPAKNSWQSGNSFILDLHIDDPVNIKVEYRLNPWDDNWQPVPLSGTDNFHSEINMDGRQPGPVHLEVRTIRNGVDDFPQYNPFNWANSDPQIQFISPTEDHSVMWGSKTVMGSIAHSIPIDKIDATVDMVHFTEVPFVSRRDRAWFGYFNDFTSMQGRTDAHLAFRITDSSGVEFFESPEYTLDTDLHLPTLIVNSPVDEEVITDTFDISGIAFDEVGISAIYWRLLGPKLESITIGAAGDEARVRAQAFENHPDLPFHELLTDQNFQIPVDFTMIGDGEYTVEMYATNPNGVQSETVSRIIKVSTLPPDTKIISPPITQYSRKAIIVHGYSGDANGIESVTLSMDNGNTYQDAVLQDDGYWELPMNTVAYTDGIYSALIKTRDKYGIDNFYNAMINIDNAAPELYLSAPLDSQHVGSEVHLMGRVTDMTLKSLTFQIINAENPSRRRVLDVKPEQIIFDTLSLSGFPQGEYIIRVIAKDLADNESIISRKIVYDADDRAAEIVIYNPMPGEIHTGPISIVGVINGTFLPDEVQLMVNSAPLDTARVDRYGVFRYEIPQSGLDDGGKYTISANYQSETGRMVTSPDHTVYYYDYGPNLKIDSHHDCDVITGRPWLSGRAWVSVPGPAEGEPPLGRRDLAAQKAEHAVKSIKISHDNGRTFTFVKETRDGWRYRLETSLLPRGPQPVLIKAEFISGEEAVRRLMLYVDPEIPEVVTVTPQENSVHRDNIQVYGTASDNFELADVTISLRPYDKFWYSIPKAIQGLYFDVKGLGATYFDVGIGLSFFDDNVRLQGQFGITPNDGIDNNIVEGGRYVGHVYGIKLLANIFYLPMDYLFGLDWAFYSMNFAVGANFSYFMMDEWRTPLYMGAIIGQWDIANINMRFFYPNWKYFRNYALYLEPELWFASTDVQRDQYGKDIKKVIPRITVGLRINAF